MYLYRRFCRGSPTVFCHTAQSLDWAHNVQLEIRAKKRNFYETFFWDGIRPFWVQKSKHYVWNTYKRATEHHQSPSELRDGFTSSSTRPKSGEIRKIRIWEIWLIFAKYWVLVGGSESSWGHGRRSRWFLGLVQIINTWLQKKIRTTNIISSWRNIFSKK